MSFSLRKACPYFVKKNMKNILIINGHPDKESYNWALAEAYAKGAGQAGALVSQLNLVEMDFNPILKYGYRKRTDLEPDLEDAIAKIHRADHIVWVFPMWWFGLPALLKGFIDRTFLPGITFEPQEGNGFQKRLLKGKTSRIIITADTPRIIDRLFFKSTTLNQFKKGTLEFCGLKPVKVTYIAPIKKSSQKFRESWLKKVALLGQRLL